MGYSWGRLRPGRPQSSVHGCIHSVPREYPIGSLPRETKVAYSSFETPNQFYYNSLTRAIYITTLCAHAERFRGLPLFADLPMLASQLYPSHISCHQDRR